MLSSQLPDLTFAEVTYGKDEVPWDLRPLVYMGGASTNTKTVGGKIDSGKLGKPLVERIEVVRQIHEVLSSHLGRGARRSTLAGQIERLRHFFRWADETGNPLDLESVANSYLHWTDALLHRTRVGQGLSEKSAYDYGALVGWVLDRLLRRSRPIIKTTRLRMPKRSVRSVSVTADKQNLEDTFAFGHFLLDIADGLSVDAVWGPLPIVIPLRNGKILEEWSGLPKSSYKKTINPKWEYFTKRNQTRAIKIRKEYAADRTLRTRYPLVNLRIETEMHMLMGQSALNLAQVHRLRMDQWKYKPSTHGFEIRTYKHRRWGPVLFEIYPEYRKVFERYLKWRTAIFPDDPDGLLFPLIRRGRHNERPPGFDLLIERCRRAGIKYLSPSALRNTNVNWMLRRTNDPDQTADEKQHSKKTLIGVYEKPSQQRAMGQIKGYWAKYDPALAAAGPGACIGKDPEPVPDIPATATTPDCKTPAGCLFCANQRDIDSLDHIWSLASYRLLKSFELAAHRQPETKRELPQHPAELAIDRLTAKLGFIRESNTQRGAWVKEALLRIDEGRYHPDWAGMIEAGPAGRVDRET